MSEEEKKAIETLKVLIGLEEFNKLSYKENQAINIALNLINKQQKEIEKLTRLNSAYKTNYYSKVLKEERKNKKILENYISKDKIRELIENNEEDISYSLHDMIEDLKKLLEE